MTEQERKLVSLVIGYQIRNSRRAHSLSQAELAHGIGSQSMISLLESGRQFPLPDVLFLIAQRLNDPVLLTYAELLSSPNWSLSDFAAANREVLLEVLRSHRGKWHEIHAQIALELCDHFYYNRIFELVCEICQLILNHSNNPSHRAKAFFYLGSTDLFLHRYEEAESWLRQSDKLSEALDEPMRARLHYNLGYMYSVMDYYGLGMWYAKLAEDAFHRTRDYPRHAKALGLLGVIQSRLGRLDDARATLQQAAELCEKFEVHEVDRARIYTGMADVCESLKDLDGAESWCHKAIVSSAAVSDYVSLSAAYRVLCLIHLARQESEKAVSAIQSSIEAAENSQDGWSLSHACLLATGLLPTERERLEAAKRAFDVAKTSNYAMIRALAAECLASLLEADDPEAAHAYRKEALKSYRDHLQKSSIPAFIFQHLPFNG
jgi:tetratricopeptide (TPR) repeat protein